MKRFGLFVVAAVTALVLSAELSFSLPVFGVGPDLLVVVVTAFACGEHPRTAAAGGFIAGLARDLLLTTPNGVSAFAYAVAAFGASLTGTVRGVWLFMGVVAGTTFVSQILYGVGTSLLAPDVNLGPVFRVAFVTTMYNVILAPLLMPILQRIAPPEGAGTGGGVD